MRHLLISHQTGATFWTPWDQIIEFIAVLRLIIAVQKAKEQAPTFHDRSISLDIDKVNKKNAAKFAIGTRGNVGSMIGVCGFENNSTPMLLWMQTDVDQALQLSIWPSRRTQFRLLLYTAIKYGRLIDIIHGPGDDRMLYQSPQSWRPF